MMIKPGEVHGKRGSVVGVDYRNRLAGSVALDSVEPIGSADLRGRGTRSHQVGDQRLSAELDGRRGGDGIEGRGRGGVGNGEQTSDFENLGRQQGASSYASRALIAWPSLWRTGPVHNRISGANRS